MGLELGLLAQIRVFNHQRHLGGNRLEQFDILLGQRVPRGQTGDEVSRVPFATNQRHHQGALDAGELGEELQAPSAIGRKGFCDLHIGRGFARKSVRQLQRAQPGQLPDRLADGANHGADFEPVRLVAREQEGGFEPECLQAHPEDRLRHGTRLAVLAQALARLRQRGEAAHLLIQRPGPLLQVRGHYVERARQLAQLVSASDVQPLRQVATGDRLRPRHQRLDWRISTTPAKSAVIWIADCTPAWMMLFRDTATAR